MQDKSVVVLSGGQDSMTCFYKALEETEVVGAINFNYGNQHASAERQAILFLESDCPDVDFKFVDLSALTAVAPSALTKTLGGTTVNDAHPLNSHLPASFVPGRNLVMLTLAAAYAQGLGASKLYTGVCQTDYSGYPDCRDETIQTLAVAIRKGLDYEIDIITPLMFLDKADTFKLAEELGVLYDIIVHSHTCYVGNHETRHDWGYGCGECPACVVRANGWRTYIERYGN